MALVVGAAIVAVIVIIALLILSEYRIRRPDVLVLYENKGQVGVRKGLVYPRHLSLPFERTTCPIQLTVEAAAAGNLGVRVKLIGSVALASDQVQTLIRVGGWDKDAVAHAAREVQILLDGLVKTYTESCDIRDISSTVMLTFLNERAVATNEKFGVEIISLAVQSLEPTDPAVADALRQQEQARLLEETERLNHQARVSAAKAKYEADEEIADMEHALELKKAELQKGLNEQEAALAQQHLEAELTRSRMRLQLEREELDVLKCNPELLLLTPQAARLAEASQSLKNARTIISLSPQDLQRNTDILTVFQELLQKAMEDKGEA
jgi:hypothetical protein